MSKNPKIGDEIRAKRESEGLTQQDLAFKVGVAVSTVSRWETGATPDPDDTRKAYDKLMAWLRGQVGEKPVAASEEGGSNGVGQGQVSKVSDQC